MIDRNDMLELTRRMTLERTCFDRIAGAYINDMGEVDGSFNIHFGKLSPKEKKRNLAMAKAVPFSRTNDQLKEYEFTDTSKGRDTMYRLLSVLQKCGLKNDEVLDIFYEQMADGYPVDHDFSVYLYHGVYDVPLKAKDKADLFESEEVYDFLICTISPLRGEYEPGDPVFGFLYPAFSERSADDRKLYIFHKDPERPEDGLLYKLLH